MRVFILATCRNLDLLPATLLVFDTLRVGFPTADVIVFDNANSELVRSQLRQRCQKTKTKLVHLPDQTIHHYWIEDLVNAAMAEPKSEPFFILDTDVIFWENFEQWSFAGFPLAGRLIPRFRCEFTGCRTQPRLHTSLLYIDPVKVGAELADYYECFPKTPFNPMANVFHPLHIPGVEEFYDTCSLLYHVVGGLGFAPEILDCYDHLHCGTISDIVGPRLTDGKMTERHQAIFKNPSLAKGLWREQDKYLASRA